MDEQTRREADIAAVVGLGNPGKQYEATRHNAGFGVVDRLSRRFNIVLQERRFPANWGMGVIEGFRILLVKPITFMNRSGEAVSPLLGFFAIPADKMLVIHDDLDLDCGRIRLVRGGGAGGHRGVSSIKQYTGDQGFPRLKLGIGRPLRGEPIESYVLECPYPDQEKAFDQMLSRGVEVVETILSEGMAAAMNQFNRRELRTENPSRGSG
jgi:PTH1 family peptidyl-tRNA hydrolase